MKFSICNCLQMNYFFWIFFFKVFVFLLLSTINFKLLHYRGNYQFTNPYKAGPTCGDCPNACKDNLCSTYQTLKGFNNFVVQRRSCTLSINLCLLQPTPVFTLTGTVTVLTWSNAGAASAVTFPPGVLPPASATVRLFKCLRIHWDLTCCPNKSPWH